MSSFSKPEGHRRPPSTMTDYLKVSNSKSERDSSFSDASSGYLSAVELTDSEDTGRVETLEGQELQGSSQVAMMGGPCPSLSPMIFMNNIILKQPSPVAPALKPWGFTSSLEMAPQSQVVLLQPLVNNNDSNSSQKSASDNYKQSRNYLPILKSYPKIAPHPGKSSSRRHGSAVERSRSTPDYERRHRRQHNGQKLYSSPSPLPGTQTPLQSVSCMEASNPLGEAVNCQEQSLPLPPDRSPSLASEVSTMFSDFSEFETLEANSYQVDGCQDVVSTDNTKLKRFHNTYNILYKSGLLGITLRTKELIKKNRRTQGMLQKLQEHTSLLVEALASGDPQVCTKLLLTLQDTGTADHEVDQGVELQGTLT